MHAFIEKQETINTQLAQSMTDFKDTLAKFTSALSFQEKGKFLSQPQQNPNGLYNANASSSRSLQFLALLENIKLKKLYLILELV